jgi:LacI family transcriptional regulator
MRITIKDIAIACGVSAGTVDRALNNRAGISEKTRQKVMKAAEEMNYLPDLNARSLVVGKTMTIGVVLFDLYNRSFAQLMNAIEKRAREMGYFTYITLTDKDPDKEKKCIEYLVNRKVDGIILLTVNSGSEFKAYLEKLNTPVVMVFNKIEENQYIGVQERKAMKEAVDYIVSKGYKRFIYISPPLAYKETSNIFTQEERYYGFMEGLKANGIDEEPNIIIDSDYIGKLREYHFSKEYKTAIVCSTDLYALEVMSFLKGENVSIPDQAGVMGYDDIDVLKYVSPRLTTIRYPIAEIGEKAVESLINKVNNGEYLSVPLLHYKLIKGESI